MFESSSSTTGRQWWHPPFKIVYAPSPNMIDRKESGSILYKLKWLEPRNLLKAGHTATVWVFPWSCKVVFQKANWDMLQAEDLLLTYNSYHLFPSTLKSPFAGHVRSIPRAILLCKCILLLINWSDVKWALYFFINTTCHSKNISQRDVTRSPFGLSWPT